MKNFVIFSLAVVFVLFATRAGTVTAAQELTISNQCCNVLLFVKYQNENGPRESEQRLDRGQTRSFPSVIDNPCCVYEIIVGASARGIDNRAIGCSLRERSGRWRIVTAGKSCAFHGF